MARWTDIVADDRDESGAGWLRQAVVQRWPGKGSQADNKERRRQAGLVGRQVGGWVGW